MGDARDGEALLRRAEGAAAGQRRGASRAHAPLWRPKPTGREPLPEDLPRVDLEVLPDDVQRAGLDAFERIGEDVSETVEWRRASVVVVRMHKPKFVPKD